MLIGSEEQEVAGTLDALVGGARQTRSGGPPPQHLPVCGRNREGSEDALEKEMATHSSVLAWRIPWMEKPGRLQSMGSHRVGYD